MTAWIPDWFDNNFVDVESLLIDLFELVLPDIVVGCWTPDSWLDQDVTEPMLQFVRLPGGQVKWDMQYDEALIQATAITGSRDDSWRLVNLLRAVLLPLQGFKFTMSDGFVAQIVGVDEVAGPQLLTTDQRIDDRVIPVTFRTRVSLRSRKRYDQIIRDL